MKSKKILLSTMFLLLGQSAMAANVGVTKVGEFNCDGYCASRKYATVLITGKDVRRMVYCDSNVDVETLFSDSAEREPELLNSRGLHELREKGQISGWGRYHEIINQCIELLDSHSKVLFRSKLTLNEKKSNLDKMAELMKRYTFDGQDVFGSWQPCRVTGEFVTTNQSVYRISINYPDNQNRTLSSLFSIADHIDMKDLSKNDVFRQIYSTSAGVSVEFIDLVGAGAKIKVNNKGLIFGCEFEI